MKSFQKGMASALLLLALGGCSFGNEPEDEPSANVTGARMSVEWTIRVAESLGNFYLIRPSALLGVYVSDYLIHTSVFQSALAGIEAQMQLILDEEEEEDEAFALLEELGIMLQVDIVDMLNRSTDRPETFDAYINGLTDVAQRATSQLEALEQELEQINANRRDSRKEVSEIQRALNEALREQDYSTASDYQRQIIDAEGELARIESMEDEQRSIINLYEELLDIAEERMIAMTSNREALLAGIQVIDVPGVDDLGLIEQGRRSTRRNSIFDPGNGTFGQ